MSADVRPELMRTMERPEHLADKVVIVDGQPGCGKTMLSPIVSALDRVELMTYAYPLEYVCALHAMGKMSDDAATTTVRMLTDLQLYDTMMARGTNFRPSDLSSALRAPHPLRYIRRLFMRGDAAIPDRIAATRPILHLTTHNLLAHGFPVAAGLGSRVVFLEVVRHPLYMLKQQALNMERLHDTVRHFTLYFRVGAHRLPYFAYGWEEAFLAANAVERAIFAMQHLTARAQEMHARCVAVGATVVTIPFERFVLDPFPFMERVTAALETTMTRTTHAAMRKQRVPRRRYADGRALRIYTYCGWEPAQRGATEEEEFARRRAYAAAHASPAACAVLDALSDTYERQFLRS